MFTLISLPIANPNGQVFKRQLPCVSQAQRLPMQNLKQPLTKCHCLKGSPSKSRFMHLQMCTFLAEGMLQETLRLCHLCCSKHWFG